VQYSSGGNIYKNGAHICLQTGNDDFWSFPISLLLIFQIYKIYLFYSVFFTIYHKVQFSMISAFWVILLQSYSALTVLEYFSVTNINFFNWNFPSFFDHNTQFWIFLILKKLFVRYRDLYKLHLQSLTVVRRVHRAGPRRYYAIESNLWYCLPLSKKNLRGEILYRASNSFV